MAMDYLIGTRCIKHYIIKFLLNVGRQRIGTMMRGIKLAHLLGLVLYLGSIVTFVVISSLIEHAGLEHIALGRKIISTGTDVLTLPGMWVLAFSGIWMGYTRYGFSQRFSRLKLLIVILIAVNTYLFVLPSVTEATKLAEMSLAQGSLIPGYKNAYIRESIFGGINVLLTISAVVVGVWRIGIARENPTIKSNKI